MANMEQKGFFIDDWWVSPTEGRISRGNDVVRLEPKAMEVLVYLASRPGEVVTREALERDVWRGAVVGYDAITGTVIKLRKALRDDARQPRFITTIPKKGYQLITPVTFPDAGEGLRPAINTADEPLADTQGLAQSRSGPWRGVIILALVGVFTLGLIELWQPLPDPSSTTTPAIIENTTGLPSIVVLPFENLGDDATQDYLGDGMTEDIITDLSRSSNLLVIASNTSYTYKDKEILPQEVGKDLNVDFVLHGNIRPIGDAIRVNTQLVDTKTGFNTWAERYDKKKGEIFAVQDEMVNGIIEALSVKLTSQEKQRLAHKTTTNLKAYDFFQEGQRASRVRTKEANQQAHEAYRKAIESDPTYGRAYGALAYTLASSFLRGWTDVPLETLDRALVLARHAVELDDSIPQTYWALGYVYLTRKEFDNAEKAAEQAINIAPNYADGYGLLSLISNNLGKPEKAIAQIKRAMRLNPYYTWDYLYNLGRANYTLGHYDEAITALLEAQERNPNAMPIKLYLAASYVRAGRQDDAEWVVQEMQMLNPALTIAQTEKTSPIANPEHKSALLEDLRKAGLAE